MKHFQRVCLPAIASLLYASQAAALVMVTPAMIPFTATTPNETYMLMGGPFTLNSGDMFFLDADNIILDGNNQTITYAMTGPGHAIRIGRRNGVEIHSLDIDHGGYVPSASEEISAVFAEVSLSGLNIHDNTIDIVAGGGFAFADGWGIQIANFTVASTGNSIGPNNVIAISGTSGGRGISVESSVAWEGDITGNTVTLSNQDASNGIPRAIRYSATGPATISQNSITLDASTQGAQGISVSGNTNVVIDSNTINSAGRKARMILVENADGNVISNNTINMTSADTSTDASAGIRIRFGADSNVVSGNVIDASIGNNSIPLRLGGVDATSPLPPVNNVIFGNQFTSKFRAVSIERSDKADFYNNTYTGTGIGQAIFFEEINKDISFNGADNVVSGAVRLQGVSNTNILFCQVTNINSVADLSLSSLGTQDATVDAAGPCAVPLTAGTPQPPTDVVIGP